MALTLTKTDEKFEFHGRSRQITKEKNELLAPYNKMILNYGIVLELLPDDQQMQAFNQQIGNARFVRNDYLNKRIALYKDKKETLEVNDYKKHDLPQLKEDYPFLKESDKFALEAALENVQAAYDNFFNNLKNHKKAGFPKFASKYKPNGNAYTTKMTNDNIKLLEINQLPYIQLPKVGIIRFILPIDKTIESMLYNGRITKATIHRANNRYFVSLQIEQVVDKPNEIVNIKRADVWGADMGLKDFCIYGNRKHSYKEPNPRLLYIHERRLKRLQKSLSRKKIRSKNWLKAKAKLAKEHTKIKNQRKDLHHQLSRKIVNKCNIFICENLNVEGMVKNHRLAKSIYSVGWSQFLSYVKYKIEKKGGLFIKVNRFSPSSKLCNKCGYKKIDLTLKDRKWVCPQCGKHHDRDINAKNNLISEGIKILTTEYNIEVIA